MIGLPLLSRCRGRQLEPTAHCQGADWKCLRLHTRSQGEVVRTLLHGDCFSRLTCAPLCFCLSGCCSSGDGCGGSTVALLVDASSHALEQHHNPCSTVAGEAYLIGTGVASTQAGTGSMRNTAASATAVTRGVGSPPSLRVRHSAS
jgi:hypothetical protein